MIDIVITESCRSMGRNQEWGVFKETVLHADDMKEAREALRGYFENIGLYNLKRRKPVYIDTKSRGTIRTGFIYSGIEDTNYLQAWCSFYNHSDRSSIDLDDKREVQP